MMYVNPFLLPSESPFLDRVRHTIRFKNMSRHTEKSYLYYIREKSTLWVKESRSNTLGDRLYEGINIR
jgi:hypothetical protein